MFKYFKLLLELLNGSLPTEKDLTEHPSYKLLIHNFPDLERQLKMAWNGDVRAKNKGEPESEYLFPKMLKTENLEKFDKKFVINQKSMTVVGELYDLFVAKFKVAHKRPSSWFTA